MIEELYMYSLPNLIQTSKSPFNIFHILCVTFVSSLSVFFGNVIFGVAITVLYVGLSLLTLLDKDFYSKYMKLVALCIFDISITGIYIFSKVFPFRQLALWIIVLGSILLVIYEISVFVKVKNKFYSLSKNKKKSARGISALTIMLASTVFGAFRKNPKLQFLAFIYVIIISSMALLGCVMSLQKLIIYLMTRNKVERNFIVQSNKLD